MNLKQVVKKKQEDVKNLKSKNPKLYNSGNILVHGLVKSVQVYGIDM